MLTVEVVVVYTNFDFSFKLFVLFLLVLFVLFFHS